MRFLAPDRRRVRPCTVLMILALGVPGPSRGAGAGRVATLPTSSRIVSVTVYPDRAEVVRESEVTIPRGSSEVVFSRIPLGVEPDSFRVQAKGVPAVLGAVELREEVHDPVRPEDFAAARSEVERVEGEIAALDSEAGVDSELLAFVTALKATTASRTAEALGEGTAHATSVQSIYAFVRASLGEIAARDLARVVRRRVLTEELTLARARAGAAPPPGAIRTRAAALEVEAERPGTLRVTLQYVVAGASWRPSYRATLDADAGEVDLVSEAVVRQSTGEDWGGVKLALSTASPARGVEPPQLSSWLLRAVEPVLSGAFAFVRRLKTQTTLSPGVADADGDPLGAKLGEIAADTMQEAAVQASDIVHSAYNVSFQVPGGSDVAADGREHRLVLRRESLPVEVAYRTVPGMREEVYLMARGHAPADYPLLTGPMRVFAGPAYLGSLHLAETAPGSELTLPFGADNRVKVSRVRLPEERSTQGFAGRERRTVFAWRTTLENVRAHPVEVALEDVIPVSEDERIEVDLERETTAGWTHDEDVPGRMTWTVTVPPGTKKEVVLRYTVRHPKDLVVAGM